MQSENLAYDWNDVALLTDQRACTFLCKTMLLVSDMEVCQLQEIHLVNWEKTLPQEDKKQLSGVMQVQIVYLDQKGKQCQLQTEIPLQGTLAMPVQALGQAKLLYGRGQVADGYLLLETVLQIPYELQLQRSQVIVGPFEMEELLELPEWWPDCTEVLTTVAVAELQTCSIQQQLLQAEGSYQFTIVYADRTQQGESLYAYQQRRPMEVSCTVPVGLQELDGVQPYYQSLSVQLLDGHHIQLTGSGVLCTLPVEHASVDSAEPWRETIEQKEALDDAPESVPLHQQKRQNSPSVVQSRGSRRANLSKYMRNLNSSVQSPTSVRNFEIGLESEDRETT